MSDAIHCVESQAERAWFRIAVIEDDDEMRGLLAVTLNAAGYQISAFRSGLDLLELLDAGDTRAAGVDLVISDVRMPGVSGLSLLEGLRSWSGEPPPPMILITAFGSPKLHAQAHDLGAVAVLDKPFAMDDLIAAVAEAFRNQSPSRGVSDSGAPRGRA
jgi:DNA-binding response OmpR family regulator